MAHSRPKCRARSRTSGATSGWKAASCPQSGRLALELQASRTPVVSPPHHQHFYLASPKHVCNSTSAQIGCGNDIFLPTGIASSNSFGCCHSNTLGHSDEIFRGRGLGRGLWGTEDLLEKKKKDYTVSKMGRQHSQGLVSASMCSKSIFSFLFSFLIYYINRSFLSLLPVPPPHFPLLQIWRAGLPGISTKFKFGISSYSKTRHIFSQ